MASRVIRVPRHENRNNVTPYSRPVNSILPDFSAPLDDASNYGGGGGGGDDARAGGGRAPQEVTVERQLATRGITQLQSDMNRVRISTVPSDLDHDSDQLAHLGGLSAEPAISVEAVARHHQEESGFSLPSSMETSIQTMKVVRKRAHDKFCFKCRLRPRKDVNPNNPVNRLCEYVETEYRADNEVDFVRTVFAYTDAMWYKNPEFKGILPEWTYESLIYCARRTAPVERHKRILMDLEELYSDSMRLVDTGSKREFPNDRQLGGLLRIMDFQQRMDRQTRGKK